MNIASQGEERASEKKNQCVLYVLASLMSNALIKKDSKNCEITAAHGLLSLAKDSVDFTLKDRQCNMSTLEIKCLWIVSKVLRLEKSQSFAYFAPYFLVNTSLMPLQQHPSESVCPSFCTTVSHIRSFTMRNLWCYFPASVRRRPAAYFDLSLLAGLGADRLDDVTVVTPDFLVVDPQAALVPAAHVDVGKPVLPDLLEVHDFISGGFKKKRCRSDMKCSSGLLFFNF